MRALRGWECIIKKFLENLTFCCHFWGTTSLRGTQQTPHRNPYTRLWEPFFYRTPLMEDNPLLLRGVDSKPKGYF